MPILGGPLFIAYGAVQLSDLAGNLDSMLLAIALMTIGTGTLLLVAGVAAIKYRRWVFSVEERLRRIEDQLAD
jgi:hypothetical protein